MEGRTRVFEVPDEIRRIVFLGDPHGDLDGVEQVMAKESDEQTLFACVGDVVGYADGPSSSLLCARLEALGVPTVEGNHEDWIGDDGTLTIVQGRGLDRRLTPEALGWIESLPHNIRFERKSTRTVLALMVHAFRQPYWDWIHTHNAAALSEHLGSPEIIVAGHSHRPKFLHLERAGGCRHTPYDFLSGPSIEAPLPARGTLIIDAGSIGRPDASEIDAIPTSDDPLGLRFGTYAVLDFSTGLASIRRILKDPFRRFLPK